MTKRGQTYFPLVIAAVLALASTSCGVKTSSDATAPTVTASGPTLPVSPPPTSSETTATTDTTVGTDRSTVPALPPGTEKIFLEQLTTSFEAGGLNNKQAKCLARAYLKRFGSDASSADDMAATLELLNSCDISPSDFGN